MRALQIATGLLAAGGLVVGQVPAGQAAVDASAATTGTVRVSVAISGEPNNINGRSARPVVNSTGTVVAYDSIATNLVVGDTNRSNDVFVRDRATGATERVSVSSAGAQGNGESTRPAISGDGRLVAYDSGADNLVPGDTNHLMDVFVRDRGADATRLVSVGLGGVPANGSSFGPAFSANGRYVAFASDADNLVAEPVSETDRQVYLRDLVTGTTELISRTTTGEPAGGASFGPSLSADGRFVTFTSFASTVVPGDTNGRFDVFLRDRVRGTTTRVSVSSSGAEAEGGDSTLSSISADGRLIAFTSEATTLVANDTNDARDVFVHDTTTGTTRRVNLGPGGVQADNESDGPGFRGGTSFGPSISARGRYVAFDSIATNLVAGDTNTCTFVGGQSFPDPGECPDIFVRDLKLGVTSRVSVSSAGAQSNDASTDPSISGDGRSVVFFTSASNLAPGDTRTCPFLFLGHPGQCPDIYLHRR